MVHHDDHYRDQSPSRGNVNHEDENDFYDALVGRPRRTVDDMRGKVRTAVALGDNNDNTNNGHEDDDNDCNGNDDAESKTTFMQQYLGRIITSILAVAIVIVVFVLLPMYAVHAAKQSRWDHMLYLMCGVFVLIAVPVSVHGIVQHLVNYYMPQVQKYVIRILFMVPIFSIQSWFSLFYHGAAFYIRAFRELYEAFVLSSFLYYIFELLGGEEQVIQRLQLKDAKYGKHGLLSRIFIKGGDWTMGKPFVTNCKYGVLQLVLVKIIGTAIMVTLQSLGKYHPKFGLGWKSPSLYIGIMMVMSITYAMYCLVKLYLATKDDLKEWNPLWKFMCIKGIIFFTFWQGFLISVLHYFGALDTVGGWDHEHVSDGLQDFLLAFEMVFFAILHRYAYPHTDYIHYLKRRTCQSTSGQSQQQQQPHSDSCLETLLLLDSDNNVVNDDDPNSEVVVDVEYAPPTVRQLDRPMSVHRALMGVVPNETLSDIARMGISGLIGDGGSGRPQQGTLGGGGDIVISRDHAELI